MSTNKGMSQISSILRQKLVAMATSLEGSQNEIPGYWALSYAYKSWKLGEDVGARSGQLKYKYNQKWGVHDSQGSAGTLVSRGGITNYHLIAYSFSNTSAKNYQYRLMWIKVIVCNVTVVFLRHSMCHRAKFLHNRPNDFLEMTRFFLIFKMAAVRHLGFWNF